jgi:fatty acid desaturase
VSAGFAAFPHLPPSLLTSPLWALWGLATGTVGMGLWVLAHECGHGAFSKNRRLETAVGYTIHSLLLVPYFSWQRSHAVHHLCVGRDASAKKSPALQQERVTWGAGGGTSEASATKESPSTSKAGCDE